MTVKKSPSTSPGLLPLTKPKVQVAEPRSTAQPGQLPHPPATVQQVHLSSILLRRGIKYKPLGGVVFEAPLFGVVLHGLKRELKDNSSSDSLETNQMLEATNLGVDSPILFSHPSLKKRHFPRVLGGFIERFFATRVQLSAWPLRVRPQKP